MVTETAAVTRYLKATVNNSYKLFSAKLKIDGVSTATTCLSPTGSCPKCLMVCARSNGVEVGGNIFQSNKECNNRKQEKNVKKTLVNHYSKI